MNANLILSTDSYKASHWLQYPPGTEYVYSYIESRGGKYDSTLFFGLQAYIKEYLSKPITKEMIDEAEEFFLAHGEPFNREGWEYILEAHEGFMPVRIDAVPEGTVVTNRNVLATIVNTDPKCFWLPSYLETTLLRGIWYPTTVATISYNIKKCIKKFLNDTGTPEGLPFKLHDFGARGVSSGESAALGGMAHLVNFMGSDTVEGVLAAKRFYHEPMAAFSIPAAEHSTITAWGKTEAGELAAYRNMIMKFGKPGAIFAVVSDSYDIFRACDFQWGIQLRKELQDSGATLVVRPDSGDPVMTVLRVVQLLDGRFGSTVNEKGFKVLNTVRVIQGDGINPQSIADILAVLKNNGYSADNIAFGMGGALLQHMNRDTQEFAMKASSIRIDGKWRDVSKSPVGQSSKNSKGGRFILTFEDGKYYTLPIDDIVGNHGKNLLEPVFVNGKLKRDMTFAEVRNNANK